jgi:hypothetical protein
MNKSEALQIIVRGAAKRAELWLEMSRAMAWFRSNQAYKPEYRNAAAWLDGEGYGISRAQYNLMCNLGEALSYINTTTAEMVAVGESSMYQIARLAKDEHAAYQNKELVADLITRRADKLHPRHLSDKQVKEAVDAALGTGKKQDAPEPSEDAPEVSGDAPDAGWWNEVCAMRAQANGDESIFAALMLERYGR